MKKFRFFAGSTAVALLATLSGYASAEALKLTGAQEVPPVQTSAEGTGEIKVAPDGALSGKLTTTGVTGTMAHIHVGAAGANGPVAIPLTKKGDNEWAVPDGAKLNAEQLQAHKEGKLYVNVHSDANKGGEIRTQLKP